MFLPVFTWYFNVIEQSSRSCWRVNPVSGISKSSMRIMSAGWWKSRTLAFLSFVDLMKSNRISTTFMRNSLVAGYPSAFCGRISVNKIANIVSLIVSFFVWSNNTAMVCNNHRLGWAIVIINKKVNNNNAQYNAVSIEPSNCWNHVKSSLLCETRRYRLIHGQRLLFAAVAYMFDLPS